MVYSRLRLSKKDKGSAHQESAQQYDNCLKRVKVVFGVFQVLAETKVTTPGDHWPIGKV